MLEGRSTRTTRTAYPFLPPHRYRTHVAKDKRAFHVLPCQPRWAQGLLPHALSLPPTSLLGLENC